MHTYTSTPVFLMLMVASPLVASSISISLDQLSDKVEELVHAQEGVHEMGKKKKRCDAQKDNWLQAVKDNSNTVAAEGKSITCESGKVWYGSYGLEWMTDGEGYPYCAKNTVKVGLGNGPITCDSKTFGGDPFPGDGKHCECLGAGAEEPPAKPDCSTDVATKKLKAALASETPETALAQAFVCKDCSCVPDDGILVSYASGKISREAFEGCSKLKTASFPNVIKIEDTAFRGCKSLKTVSFPKVTTIATSAFTQCTSLKTVSFPKVTTIDKFAFSSCKSLKTVSFPKVTTIGIRAFWGCSFLKTVSFPKLLLKNIGSNAFEFCYSLTTVPFNEMVS